MSLTGFKRRIKSLRILNCLEYTKNGVPGYEFDRMVLEESMVEDDLIFVLPNHFDVSNLNKRMK